MVVQFSVVIIGNGMEKFRHLRLRVGTNPTSYEPSCAHFFPTSVTPSKHQAYRRARMHTFAYAYIFLYT